MSDDQDPGFFARADAVIGLANTQLKDASRGKVSASLMYATARFNSWISAHGFESASEMAGAKDEALDYFVAEYRKMLEETLDDYIANSANYMKPPDA